MPYIKTYSEGVTLKLHVQPGAARPGVVGRHGDALKIKVAAPPEDGRANQEVCELLARLLGCGKKDVELISGASSRQKVVRVLGISEAQVRSVLGV